jgi:hypothetical protein
LALIAAGSVSAAEIVSCSPPEGLAYIDFSDEGLLSFDLFFSEASAAEMVVSVSPTDALFGSILFRAYLYNKTGGDVGEVTLAMLGGATFETVGTVRDFYFASVPVVSTAATARILPHEPVVDLELLEIGALQTEVAGAVDWTIDVAALASASNEFTLRVEALPEPASAAWVACSALAALANRQRRRRRRRRARDARAGSGLSSPRSRSRSPAPRRRPRRS